jgi:DNA-binding MarR family transcriptional regulator
MADLKETLSGLFIEAAIIEHLTRARIETRYINGLEAGQFGILSYFARNHPEPDSIDGLAWAFQEGEERITRQVANLHQLGYVALTDGLRPGDTMVTLTPEGREVHRQAIERMAPDFTQIVSEIPVADLETTHRVLHEIRLVMDNLPDR